MKVERLRCAPLGTNLTQPSALSRREARTSVDLRSKKEALYVVIFRQIEFGSEAYREACKLRNAVLRVPIGLNLFDEDLSLEKSQMHFALIDPAGLLIGCIIAVPLSSTDVKIRQMAVRPSHQRQGYGREIIRRLEHDLVRQGFTQVSMNARLEAVPFYESLGYSTTGDDFVEVGIPHVRMQKTLACSGD